MEGKTILRTLDIENRYQALYFDDDTIAIVKIVTPDISLVELKEFLGELTKKAELVSKSKEKTAPAKKEKDEEPESDGDEYTWADLLAMNYKQLKKFVTENELSVEPDDYETDEVDEFRKEIAEEIDVDIPEEKVKAKEEDDDDDDTSDDKYTWADLLEMDSDELEELIDEQKLDADPDEHEDEGELRRAIAKEMDIEIPKKKKN